MIGEVIEKSTDIRATGNHTLNNSTKRLKNGRIVDGSKKKLYFFYIYIIFC